jgi:hypothetical protein
MSLELTKVDSPRVAGYQEVWLASAPAVSYRAILAIPNTHRGPALGGLDSCTMPTTNPHSRTFFVSRAA